MDHYVCLSWVSTPRAPKDSLNLGSNSPRAKSPRAVGFPCFKLPLSARVVVKPSLTKRKSIIKMYHQTTATHLRWRSSYYIATPDNCKKGIKL